MVTASISRQQGECSFSVRQQRFIKGTGLVERACLGRIASMLLLAGRTCQGELARSQPAVYCVHCFVSFVGLNRVSGNAGYRIEPDARPRQHRADAHRLRLLMRLGHCRPPLRQPAALMVPEGQNQNGPGFARASALIKRSYCPRAFRVACAIASAVSMISRAEVRQPSPLR